MNPIENSENLDKIFEQKKENKVILFEDHKIELLSEKGAIEFSEKHIKKIETVLNLFSKINPELAKTFSEFKSINAAPKFYGVFPANGENIQLSEHRYGIRFYNSGMDMNRPHRISLSANPQEKSFVDNFFGTLAHELTEGGGYIKLFNDKEFNKEFIQEWQEKFGWKTIFPIIKNEETGRWEKSSKPTEGWEKNKDGKWQNGDYIVMADEFTTMPEICIGGTKGYAASVRMAEDICDSVAAYLLNPSVLNEDKREFLANKINEYKRRIKKAI